MGIKVYYLIQILIFAGIGIFSILKPKILIKLILKRENSKLINLIRVLGFIALLNAVMNINKLMW